MLRLKYGDFSYLLAGDLNDQSSRSLMRAAAAGTTELRSEVFKAPHHGSADFSAKFLEAVSPVVSVISSGDESERKEYIHPRATLVGALGKYSRLEEPLIFVTEMVAFFKAEGYLEPEGHKVQGGVLVPDPKARPKFLAFSRTAFGIVKTRTDGRRLLIYTNSGQADLKEVYAYKMTSGQLKPVRVRQA